MPPLNDSDFAAFGSDDFQIPCRPGTVTVHDSNVGATKQVGEPDFDGTVGGHSVWWWWESPGNGTVTISVNPDYVNGTPLTAPLLLVYDCDVDCDYDHPVAEGHGSVTFTAKQGIDYVVGVDGVAGQQGDFALTLVRPTPPLNDLFAGAEELVGDAGSTTGSTNWACFESGDPTGFNNVWYKWTPSASGWAKLTQTLADALSTGNRQVAVYAGGAGAWTPLALRSASVAGDVAAGSEWDVYFPVAAGTTYYVVVSGRKRDGAGLDRFGLDWFAPMDLGDQTPADVAVGPAVSSTTLTVNEPTPGGTWFRFEFDLAAGTLPTVAGADPGHVGLLEFKDLAGTIIGQLRLAGDALEVRNGNGVSDPWQSLGKASTIGDGIAKVRVEFYFWRRFDADRVEGRIRVNGVPSTATLATDSASYGAATVRYGCLWNPAANDVTVDITSIGARTDPDLGPWCSTDPDDLGVTFLWGGEGGELGLSSAGANWVDAWPTGGTDPPTVVVAPGAGPSPAGRYGYALDVATTTVEEQRGVKVLLAFSPRHGFSFYFFIDSGAGGYPDTDCTFARVLGLGGGTLELLVSPGGTLSVRVGDVTNDEVALHLVSMDRWHHVEILSDFLSPGWPSRVRLNGIDFGPFYNTFGGERQATDANVPAELDLGVVGTFTGAANFGLSIKDIVVYHQNAYPLGGQTIRKRVPDGVGTHDANVDEWVGGSNTQTPITDGDDRFDYSSDLIGAAPASWLNNLHFANPSAISVEIASGSPPAPMVGARVIRYTPNAPPRSGAYVLCPPPAFANGKRYLIEAWIKKVGGADGRWDSWAGLIELQTWPWPTGTGGWFRFSQERAQIGGSTDQFGFNNNNTSGPNEIGPITIWEDFVYEPRATGFWQSDDDGATYTSIQDADATSYLKLQEWPPEAGGRIVGVGPATTGWVGDASPAGNSQHYLEYTLQDGPAGVPIYAARLYLRGRAYTWHNRTVDPTDGSIVYPSRGGSWASAATLFAQGVSGAARRWLPALDSGHDSYVLPVDSGDEAWTPTRWAAWMARLGYPLSAAPDASPSEPVVGAFAVELLMPEPELPPEGGGVILGFSFRAERPETVPASPTSEAPVHLSGIEFRT